MVGIQTQVPRIAGDDRMALKNHIRSARDGLGGFLAGWEPPTRLPLSVEPLLAASCLRLGLRLGDVDLANAAAANLVVFDPDRLWRELLAYAATEAGPFDLTPALATLAAKKEPIWRRKVGGDWKVVTALIEQLRQQARSDAPLNLWRLSFSEAEHPDPVIRQMAEDARAIRLGIVRTPEWTPDAERAAEGVHERLAEDIGGWRLIAAATALWRQTGEGAALMLPVFQASLAGARTAGQWSLYGNCTVNSPSASQSLLAALTHRTRAGRDAIREVVATMPELAAHAGCSLTESQVLEAVGDLLTREDEEATGHRDPSPDWGLREASRWSGVPTLSEREAKGWGQTIRAKDPVIAEIRRRYLPTALTDFARHEPPGGP